jgi:hypothetical protein
VYREVYAGPPYHEGGHSEAFVVRVARQAGYGGFRAVVARSGGAIVGLSYGYTSAPGLPVAGDRRRRPGGRRRRALARGLLRAGRAGRAPGVPRARARRRLHDALLAGLPHATAVLATWDGDSSAAALYRKRGRVPLLTGFRFPGTSYAPAIMGLDLRARP